WIRLLLLLTGACLPTTGVVILRAVAAPLNHRRTHWARPRFVHAVFFERTTWLAPIRIRCARVGHVSPPLKAADGVVRAAREIRRTATTTKNVADQEQRRGLHHRTKAAYRSQMSLGFLVI